MQKGSLQRSEQSNRGKSVAAINFSRTKQTISSRNASQARVHIFVIPQVQVKGNALRDMLSQPPARVTGLVSRPRDRRVEPIAIELEKLSRVGAEIGKFFFKRDHDSY